MSFYASKKIVLLKKKYFREPKNQQTSAARFDFCNSRRFRSWYFSPAAAASSTGRLSAERFDLAGLSYLKKGTPNDKLETLTPLKLCHKLLLNIECHLILLK